MFGDKARKIAELKKAVADWKVSRDAAVANVLDAQREVATLSGQIFDLKKKLDQLQPKFDHITIRTTRRDYDLWVPEFDGGAIVEELHKQLNRDSNVIGVSTDDQDFVFLASDFKSVSVDYGVRKSVAFQVPVSEISYPALPTAPDWRGFRGA